MLAGLVSNSWPQVLFLPQSPKVLGLQERATAPGLIVYVFFICPSAEHLDCFHVLSVVDNAAADMRVQISPWDMFLFPSVILSEVALLDV